MLFGPKCNKLFTIIKKINSILGFLGGRISVSGSIRTPDGGIIYRSHCPVTSVFHFSTLFTCACGFHFSVLLRAVTYFTAIGASQQVEGLHKASVLE